MALESQINGFKNFIQNNQQNMKFHHKVRVALHFIEDNLPAGEEGIYAVVNNAGVRNEDEIFFC